MAPIPALWLVAGLGLSVVVVGDCKQLAPIHQASGGRAKKWLGRDIFAVSEIDQEYERGSPQDWCIALTEQYRMHPSISAIPNELIYHMLEDDPKVLHDGDELSGCYDEPWGHDAPVRLVDTASINAWVTSVPTGRGSSRLIFLSAATAVGLAERMLLARRPALPEGEKPRIIIATPNRPQARLLDVMIQETGREGEVVAGTAHQFQGSEAPLSSLTS